jgi:hypothetical protein
MGFGVGIREAKVLYVLHTGEQPCISTTEKLYAGSLRRLEMDGGYPYRSCCSARICHSSTARVSKVANHGR